MKRETFMKKYFGVIVILNILFLQGCNKNDDSMSGKGEIRYNGHIYQLKNVYHQIYEEGGVTFDDIPYYSYYHVLTFTGADWGTCVTVPIRLENNEIASGEFHVELETISHEYNSIQMEINLADDFVHFAHNYNPAKRKMNLSYTKEDDIFEIELKYVDDESDFLVKWKGTLKDKSNL